MEPMFVNEITVHEVSRLIGILGFLLYMLSFAALQLRAIDGNSIAFSWINVVAAACVLISLTTEFNLPSALIQISWIAIGLSGIAIRTKQKQSPSGSTTKHM